MRTLIFAAIAAASLSPAAAFAANDQYRAVPVSQPDRASYVTRDTLWKCADGACVAGHGRSRPEVMCERIVQHIGKLSEFSVSNEAFDPDALAKCNARAG